MPSDRHSRQTRLAAIGESGQQRFADSRVLIIGLGGLGSPASLYLAAAGIGHLVLSDFDVVEDSNLQRQIVHQESTCGELKVTSAAQRLQSLDSSLEITTIDHELDGEELVEQVTLADVVLDCTDNFPSRYELNSACLQTNTPWVSAAAIRQEGQLTSFDPRQADSPCYECLYPNRGLEGATCAAEGILAPVVGMIGTAQAQETLNLLLGRPALVRTVLMLDAQRMDWRKMRLSKRRQCPSCEESKVSRH